MRYMPVWVLSINCVFSQYSNRGIIESRAQSESAADRRPAASRKRFVIRFSGFHERASIPETPYRTR